MNVSELFRRLSYGELSNLAISEEGSGKIVQDKVPQLILYINEGLIRLYTRFIISEKSLIIEQVEHITNYHFKRQFAETSGSNEPYLYIKDLPGEPFEEDVIKVLSVFDSTGAQRPLNDIARIDSLFTPHPETLQVPNPISGIALSITYQARHPKLRDLADPDPMVRQEFEVPVFLEGALQNFVAHKVFSHMNGQENMVKSQEYLAAYETICLSVEQSDLLNQANITSFDKFNDRGFV